jgi:type II secretory pathway pseudopilin PulG
LSKKTPRPQAAEQGMAMVSMLIVVVILGVLVTVVLAGPHSPAPAGTTASGSPTTTTTPQSIASIAPEAQLSACQADFALLEAAINQYQALNGSFPATGTTWANSTANGGPFLQSWPSGAPNFSISWNGAQLIVVPRQGPASRGTYGTSSPATGCFAP